jgi:carbon starvation protein
MVAGWGYFLLQGVRDPLGGINSLWPLFGIANQMLAGIALCLATTIILKTQLAPGNSTVQDPRSNAGRPVFALITLLPLAWLLAATMTAGVQKIWHSDPRIGFLAQADFLSRQAPALEKAVSAAKADGGTEAIAVAEKALRANRVLHFNNLLDATVAAVFLLFMAAILLLSIREWFLLLARRKLAVLRESEPVWLPDYAIVEAQPLHLVGLAALGFALAKELSGEAQLERVQEAAIQCRCGLTADEQGLNGKPLAANKTKGRHYVEMTEKRFNGVTRCC